MAALTQNLHDRSLAARQIYIKDSFLAHSSITLKQPINNVNIYFTIPTRSNHGFWAINIYTQMPNVKIFLHVLG
jgi:hypothetical protein